MATKKTYFQGLGELVNNPELEKFQEKEFAEKLKKRKIEFIIEPYVRFKGLTGEQATMFFKDPSGNALEFKSFKDPSQIFAN